MTAGFFPSKMITRGRDVPASKNKKSETNKSQKSEIPSSDERKLYAAGKLKVKSSSMGTKKRRLEVVEECRKEKRQKMDRSATQQCCKVLRELNRGRTIVEPRCMLRGSANSIRKLAQNGDKASSVRVGLLPKTLTSAKEKQKFWNWGRANVGQRRMSVEEKEKLREQILEVSKGKIPLHLQGLLKKLGFNRLREEKIELDIDAFAEETLIELKEIIRSFIGARAAKTTNGVQQSERKINHKRGADSGHRSTSGSAANVNTPLNLVTSKCGSCGSIRCHCGLQRDYARLSSSGLCSERSLGQAHLDTSRKDYERKIRSSSQMSKSDLDSDGSARALAQERICSLNEPASGEDCTRLVDVQLSPEMALRAAMLRSRYAKIILKANTFLAHGDKADLVLLQKDKESLKRQQREEKFTTEAAQTRAAEAASRTELKKQREQERKAARLALEQMERTVEIDDNHVSLKDLNDMLMGSWSDTDPAVVLGPIGGIHVEKFKTEVAQTRAAEAASRTELKKQREKERKAARLALEQMERTVEIDDNLVSLKDLNDMLRGSWSDTDPAVVLGPIGGIHVGNVLQRLGLFLKDDSMGDEVILNGDIEEGEIIS